MTRRKSQVDKEVEAMAAAYHALKPLKMDEFSRAINWVAARYTEEDLKREQQTIKSITGKIHDGNIERE